MKIHFYLIINENAGSGNGKKTAKNIIKKFQQQKAEYTTLYTEYAGHEIELTHELAQKKLLPWSEEKKEDIFPLMVVFGGDGTLHTVVNTLNDYDAKIPVGYIPCGSGNDFARGVGISRQADHAFQQLMAACEPKEIQVITYDESIQGEKGIAINNIGLGIDAAISDTTNKSSSKQTLNKVKLGSFAYILSVLNVLFKQKGFPILVEMNGTTFEFNQAFLCTITKHPYFGGGVAIAPDADPRKNVLDFVLVERVHLFKIFWLIILLFRKKQKNSRYFHNFQTGKIRIVSTIPQPMHADGESLGQRSIDCSFSTVTRLFWF